MDAVAARTVNFRLLVDQLAAKGAKRAGIAVKLDMSPSFLSQLYGGKKIGDDLARKLEKLQKLPRGWLDHEHRDESVNLEQGAQSQSMRLDPSTMLAALTYLSRRFMERGGRFDPFVDTALLCELYEIEAAKQWAEKPTSKILDFGRALAERIGRQRDDADVPGGLGKKNK